MNRKDKVISLELAQQIAEEHKRLGIEVESEWWWAINDKIPEQGWYLEDNILAYSKEHILPAYDTAELGEMLKMYGLPSYDKYHKSLIWRCFYNSSLIAEATTEAEARGKMYLWLLQNGYIAEAFKRGEI